MGTGPSNGQKALDVWPDTGEAWPIAGSSEFCRPLRRKGQGSVWLGRFLGRHGAPPCRMRPFSPWAALQREQAGEAEGGRAAVRLAGAEDRWRQAQGAGVFSVYLREPLSWALAHRTEASPGVPSAQSALSCV